MVKHVILWKLKEEYSGEEAAEIKKGVKNGLEGLKGEIPGFENEEALKGYTVHPKHVEVATTKVRPFVASRTVMDCEA